MCGGRFQERAVETLDEQIRIKRRGRIAVDPEPASDVDRAAERVGVHAERERRRIVVVAETIVRVLRLAENVAAERLIVVAGTVRRGRVSAGSAGPVGLPLASFGMYVSVAQSLGASGLKMILLPFQPAG